MNDEARPDGVTLTASASVSVNTFLLNYEVRSRR